MSNTYIIAHYKILSIINLVLFLSFCEIINLFLSSIIYQKHYAISIFLLFHFIIINFVL